MATTRTAFLLMSVTLAGLWATPSLAGERYLSWPGKGGTQTASAAPKPTVTVNTYPVNAPQTAHRPSPVTAAPVAAAPVTYDYHPVDINGVKPYVPLRNAAQTPQKTTPVSTPAAKPYDPPARVSSPAPVPPPSPIAVPPPKPQASQPVQYDAPPKKSAPKVATTPLTPPPAPVMAPKPVPTVSAVTHETPPPADAPFAVPATSKYASRIKAARDAHNREAQGIGTAPAAPVEASAPEIEAPISAEQTDHVFIPGELITNPETQSPRVYSLHRAYGMQPDAIPQPQSDNNALLETHFDAQEEASESTEKDE